MTSEGDGRAAGSPRVGGLASPRVAVPLVFCALAIGLAARTWLHSFDDAYITYTYARSLAGGLGLTWNGVPGLGTTSPLLAVLLAGLERAVPLGVPVWGHLLSWLAAWATALALWRLGGEEGWPLAGFVAGLGWLLAPSTHLLLGSELLPATAAVCGAALAFRRDRPLAAGAALALAVGLRSEVGLAAVLLALMSQLARPPLARPRLVRLTATALASWAAWLVVLWVLAGSFLPSTLAAKRAQAEAGVAVWAGGLGFLRRLARSFDAPFYSAGLAVFAALAIAGGCLALARGRRWSFALALVAWGPCHVIALTLLDVPYYPWYSLPLHLSLILAVALVVETPAPGRLAGVVAGRLPALASALLVALFLYNSAPRLIRGLSDPRQVAYRAIAEWINERYPAETGVAFIETGYLGFFGDFRTLDLLGVAVEGAPLDAVAARDYPRIVDTLKPDLLVLAQAMAGTGEATVGPPKDFLTRFELDHTALDRWPHLYLYRDRSVAAGGSVTLDLLADTAARGGARLVYRVRGGRAAPALVLRPGRELSYGVSLEPGQRLVSLCATEGRGSSRHALELQAREVVARDAGPATARRWEHREVVWDGPAEPVTATLRCARTSSAPCLFALPHLAKMAKVAKVTGTSPDRVDRLRNLGDLGAQWPSRTYLTKASSRSRR